MAVTAPWPLGHPAQSRPRRLVWRWRALMPALRKQDTPASVSKRNTYETFEDLLAGRETDIFGYLWRLTGDEQTAYDLCQETFLRAWQQFGKIRHYEQPGAWLFRVATNLALNAIERRSHASERVVPLREDHHPSVEDASGRIARFDQIHQTLLRLSARERIALVLREVEGFSSGEIAQALDISANSVRMLLSRARAHFRQHYERQEEGA
ncbi:MAG TPA: sigma-70 family RNA polymerase sigma factor [Ktedonobacterales bacterium]|nr:sigma-70 family RNA polymerase sigma factor [Ktedonobacterales bacterium]